MARIAGVDLPNNKRGEIGLTYIFGIGRSSARKILSQLGIDFDTKVGDWNDEDEHQASDGYRMLQRNPSPSRTPCPWSEHQEQRPHKKGQEENRCKQEEGNQITGDELWQRKRQQQARKEL